MIDASNSASVLSASLSTSQSKLLTALEELGSGSSINSAADNPAGAAQAESYSVQLSADAQAISNIQNSFSLLDTAGSALGQIAQGLQDMRTLSVQAGDAALNASDRQAIQAQIGQIGESISQIVSSTQFNGQNLLDGSGGTLSLQVGAKANETQPLSLANTSVASFGLSSLDVTTPSGQSTALASLDNAIQQVSSRSSNIGSLQNSLSSALSNLSANYNNISSAKSLVSDTDYAQVLSAMSQANVQQQASIAAVASYNSTQKNSVLGLLPK